MNRNWFRIVNLIAVAALLGVTLNAADDESVQVKISGPASMRVHMGGAKRGEYSNMPLVAPVALEMEPGLHELKLTTLEGHEGVSFYPSLEVAPVNVRTKEFLDHAQVTVRFTNEDFDQAFSGNFVTKVVLLPNAKFAELALAGVDALVSTRLDPGVDAMVEADRRGAILAIVRLGNKDKELHKPKVDERRRVEPEKPNAKVRTPHLKRGQPEKKVIEFQQRRGPAELVEVGGVQELTWETRTAADRGSVEEGGTVAARR